MIHRAEQFQQRLETVLVSLTPIAVPFQPIGAPTLRLADDAKHVRLVYAMTIAPLTCVHHGQAPHATFVEVIAFRIRDTQQWTGKRIRTNRWAEKNARECLLPISENTV